MPTNHKVRPTFLPPTNSFVPHSLPSSARIYQPPLAITRGGGVSRKRWAESAKHLAFLRFRFTDPCLSFALHRSCDTNIQYIIDIIIINRRYNLLLREGSSSPFFPFLFFPLLLFSLSGRNCNNEGEDQRSSTFFRLLWRRVGRGRLRGRAGRIGGKKEAQFLPAVFRFNCTRGVREGGRVKARDG